MIARKFPWICFIQIFLGSDIDLVCFYPETAEFTHFVGYLRDQLVACSLVMPLQKIVYLEKALAPILSFYYDNIPVDISFCPLDPMMLFNDIDLVPDTHVFPLLDDVRLWRPLNGHRATELLRLIVPDFMIFQKVLVHVKGWAIQQGIYSNVLGYFSGMALAIMVAKICRKYPGSGVGVLTRQFFKFYASYDWSVPLTLGGPFYVPEFSQIFEAADYGGQSSMVVRMNPDHYHPDLYAQNTQKYAFSSPMKVMPLTFPYFPVTAYVTDSTLAVLQRELAKGHAKMEKLFQETKASVSSETTTLIHLPNIYVPSDFFTRYTRYVVVLLGYPDLNVLTKFSNFVESKARVSIFNYLQDRYKLIVPSSDSTNNNSGIRNGSISNPTTLLQLEPFGEKICFGYEAGANKDDWLKQFLDLYVIESESEKTAEKASEADEPPEIVGESSDFGSSIDTNKPSSNGESISSATNPTRTFYHCSVLIAGVTSRPTGRATGKAIKMMSAIEYSASLKDPQFYLQQEEEKQKRSFEGSGLNVEHLSKLCDEVNRGSVAPLIWDDIGDIFRSGGGFKSIFHEVLLLSVDKLPLALFTNSCRK